MKKFQFGVFAMMIMALVCVGFTSCGSSDDDDNGGGGSHDSNLVGTWYNTTSQDKTTIAYRFDANGKCYYNEWWKDEKRELKELGTWSTSNNFVTMVSEGKVKNYYRYEISNGGKVLNFYRKDDNGEYTKKSGDYIKQ